MKMLFVLLAGILLVSGCTATIPEQAAPGDVQEGASDTTAQIISDADAAQEDIDTSETEDIISDLDEVIGTI
ncbi:MAG: hypothetical protein HY364_00265 [Candidatus Aenigmarchaeota archaeon]|nr:hypothetical protein [Candidatus Aenigmarchaeota archaeon]